MKTEINKEIDEILSLIAIMAFLVFVVIVSLLSFSVHVCAAGNSSSDSNVVYDGNYIAWTNGSGQSEIVYEAFEYEGVTYYIPSYRDDSNKKLLYSQCFVNKNNGYVYDDKIDSLLVHPAILFMSYMGIYDSVSSYHDYYEVQWPDMFTDVNIIGPLAPLIDVGGFQYSEQYNEDIKDYYYYIATGAFPAGIDRSRITLPDGWVIDEDGVPKEYVSEIILKSSGTIVDNRNSSFPYEKSIGDYGDKRMCFYIENANDSEVYRVYCNITLEDYFSSDLTNRSEFIMTTSNFRTYNLASSLLNYGENFYILGNNCYTDKLFSGSEGSHGGGHFGTDVNYLYGLVPIVRGYPVLVNGCFDENNVKEFLSSFALGSPEVLFRYIIGLNFGSRELMGVSPSEIDSRIPNDLKAVGDYIYSALFSKTYYFPIEADSLIVTRPVFKNKTVASEWYESGFVNKRSDIYYIPKGYYYHKDTRILDTNPLSSDESVFDDDGSLYVGWENPGITPISNTNKTVNNKYEYHVSSGEGVTVIVTQENNNNQTNDNNQNVIVPNGNGNIEDAFPVNDIGDGLVWMGQLSGSLRSTSESDNDSSTPGAINTNSFTNLLGGTFKFLPAAFTTLLLIGLIGAVLLRFLGR